MRHNKIVLIALCYGLTSPAMSKQETVISIPNQRISLSLISGSWVRATETKTIPGTSGMGLGLGYQLFLGENLALNGNFGMNLGSQSEVALLGGGAGLTFYILGGALRKYEDAYIQHTAIPSQNLWLAAGLGFYSFDFTVEDSARTEEDSNGGSTLTVKDPKDVSTGSVTGLYFELGYNMPLSQNLIPGLALNYYTSFESAAAPSITATFIMLQFSYILK